MNIGPPGARVVAFFVTAVLLLAACGQGEQTVDPGPEETDDSTTTTTSTTVPEGLEDVEDADDQDSAEDEAGELVTDGDATTTTTEPALIGTTGDSSSADTAAFVVADDAENPEVFIELAGSGLVLTVEEQDCVDSAAAEAAAAGADQLDGVIGGVQDCATPKAMDDFASTLIIAGGQPLPPTEAACVSSLLRDAETYRPFWSSLLAAEQFDFLLADTNVQNTYLDLYADCVSIGRAVAEQTNAALSIPTMGCIDDLYADREFVRVTIEADLSGNVEELARIDNQLSGCMTADEQELIYGS